MSMAYKTRNGRRIKVAAHGACNGRQRLVALDGAKATFECLRAGHRMTKDYSKGRSRMSEWALKNLARYWGLDDPAEGEARGHCLGWCQKCQNEIDAEDART